MSGRRQKAEGKLTGFLPLAENRAPEALPRLQKTGGRAIVKCVPSQSHGTRKKLLFTKSACSQN